MSHVFWDSLYIVYEINIYHLSYLCTLGKSMKCQIYEIKVGFFHKEKKKYTTGKVTL